jgi:F0F1-type ATP synthase assembly protein I
MQLPPTDPGPPQPRPSDRSSAGPDNGLGLRDVIGLGGLLVGAVVLSTLLGWVADHAFGTDPALTLAGLAIGIVGGIAGCWARVRRFLG